MFPSDTHGLQVGGKQVAIFSLQSGKRNSSIWREVQWETGLKKTRSHSRMGEFIWEGPEL